MARVARPRNPLYRPDRAPSESRPRTILFIRDLTVFTGGHLKTWQYFGHVLAHPAFDAAARFTDRSIRDSRNPWIGSTARVVAERDRFRADALFLGGPDWQQLSRQQRLRSRIPVLNIIQAVHHADPASMRYKFLSYRAIRICVSSETADAVAATGRCNGPLVTIPNGIELDGLPKPRDDGDREFDLLIAGKKAPGLARSIGRRMERPGRRIRVMDAHVPHRQETLDAINRARVTLFLPNPTEGFYLPAIEAMAMRSLVVCPDVIGNRSFCIPEKNCFFPAFQEDELVDSTEAALALTGSERERMLQGGENTALQHDIAHERAAFHEVLDHLDELYWQ